MTMAASDRFEGLTTHRGIVNTPECDENGHMNVQFYWARFEKADAQFRMMAGLDHVDLTRADRHVRYHAELHGAFGFHIVSRFGLGPSGEIMLLHCLIDSDRDVLSATAVDRLLISDDVAALIRARGDLKAIPADALPRSLKGPDPDFGQSEADWHAQGAVLTCRTAIEPHLANAAGEMTDRGLVALSVEAAPASWSYGGLPQDVLRTQGLGRVALEKRLVIQRRPRVSELVHILTRIIAVERTTFSVRHHLYDSRTGEFLAVCAVTLVSLDLARRKAVPLPDEVRQRMQALASGTPL